MTTAPENPKSEIRNSKFLICLLAVAAALMSGCPTTRNPQGGPAGVEIPGEPHNYSAIVSRTVDDGAHQEVTVTRFARLGEMLREQWNQDGETLVSIWRPDLGKVFLLSLARRAYVESDLSGAWMPGGESASPDPSGGRLNRRPNELAPGMSPKIDPDEVDRAFEYEAAPEHVETEELPEVVIDGRSCRVFRQRAVFTNGLIETVRTFRSPDLEGLAIRVESETEGSAARIKVLTERRDVRTDVTPDQFDVPSGFTRVTSLAHR
ncbi:MAG TPA: hypothetical protein VGV87_09805 [Blastocatellia bacterium]|nr:hypothetical protein [Blastocatellia bacterium]